NYNSWPPLVFEYALYISQYFATPTKSLFV
ncbi:MAG: hypothetical protein ACI9K1_002241, partial [Arcticibacterium sp.]